MSSRITNCSIYVYIHTYFFTMCKCVNDIRSLIQGLARHLSDLEWDFLFFCGFWLMFLCVGVGGIEDRLPNSIKNCDEFQVMGKYMEKILDWENTSSGLSLSLSLDYSLKHWIRWCMNSSSLSAVLDLAHATMFITWGIEFKRPLVSLCYGALNSVLLMFFTLCYNYGTCWRHTSPCQGLDFLFYFIKVLL